MRLLKQKKDSLASGSTNNIVAGDGNMIGNNDDFYGSDIGDNNDRDGFDANTINTNMPALPSSDKLVANLLEAIKDDVKEGIKRELKEELTHELKRDLSKDIADVVKAEMAAAAVATGVREDSINVDNIGTYDRYSYCGETNTTDNWKVFSIIHLLLIILKMVIKFCHPNHQTKIRMIYNNNRLTYWGKGSSSIHCPSVFVIIKLLIQHLTLIGKVRCQLTMDYRNHITQIGT